MVEFMPNDEWKLGRLVKDKKTFNFNIVEIDDPSKVMVEKIEQLKARIRVIREK